MWFRRLLIPFSTLTCVAWLLVSGAIFLPISWLLRVDRKGILRFFALQSRVIYAALRPIILRLTIVHKAREPGPSLYVANHQSILDPFVFWKLGLGPVVFVAKSWPFKLPVYGYFLRKAGSINTEGGDLDALCEAIQKQLEQGFSVVFFPEGSRRTTLGFFHSLPFHIALRLRRPVIPICIDGHNRILPPKCHFPRTASVRYTVLPSLQPADFPGEEGALRFAQKAKALISCELAKTGSDF